MRTISSFTLVGTLLPPKKAGWPLLRPLFAGKIPACSSAVEFGSIMQEGMRLPEKEPPGVIPAGATPPGQFLNKKAGSMLLGTVRLGKIVEPNWVPAAGSAPPYHAVSGTVCFKVCP